MFVFLKLLHNVISAIQYLIQNQHLEDSKVLSDSFLVESEISLRCKLILSQNILASILVDFEQSLFQAYTKKKGIILLSQIYKRV